MTDAGRTVEIFTDRRTISVQEDKRDLAVFTDRRVIPNGGTFPWSTSNQVPNLDFNYDFNSHWLVLT